MFKELPEGQTHYDPEAEAKARFIAPVLYKEIIMEEIRARFEKWLHDTYSDAGTWNIERNCYDEFAVHMAFKGYQAGLSANKWQPIETAPMDGSLILLCRIGTQEYRSCGEWTEHRGGYWTTDFAESVSPESLMSGQPTHWMPLPEKP